VIELIILSQTHFSEFNLGAWWCRNLGNKVVGCGRATGGAAGPPQIPNLPNCNSDRFPKFQALGATTTTNWCWKIITKVVLDRLNIYLCPIFAACHLDENW